MNVRDFVLLVLASVGGVVRGKTKLQKQVYFVGELTRVDVALGYKAHYYGPYSSRVDNALDELWSLGLIEKHTNSTGQRGERGYEKVRYDFTLTDAGKRAVAQITGTCPADAAAIANAGGRLTSAGDLHYMDLAAAAKTHFILQQSGALMDDEEITKTAGRLNWDLGSPQIDQATGFLVSLRLARKKQE
ncbi:MAG TPA: hypothetical protein DEP45_04375 [Armatimonadetes bacterium]|nr:hypothetical protein [Armatimonadota bacterium]